LTPKLAKSLWSETISSSIAKGVHQSELSRILGMSSRDVSRLARTLEKKGLISRKRILEDGRYTFLLTVSEASSEQALSGHLRLRTWEPRKPNLDFIAPDITRRARQFVELRLQGRTINEIAKEFGVSHMTVETNLKFARNPRTYFLRKAQAQRKYESLAFRSAARLRTLLSERGFAISDDPSIKSQFRQAIDVLVRSEEVKSIEFPNKAYVLGTLAGKAVAYTDCQGLAREISRRISTEVLADFPKWKERHWGKPNSVLAHRSQLTMILNDVAKGDKTLVETVKNGVLPSYNTAYYYERQIEVDSVNHV